MGRTLLCQCIHPSSSSSSSINSFLQPPIWTVAHTTQVTILLFSNRLAYLSIVYSARMAVSAARQRIRKTCWGRILCDSCSSFSKLCRLHNYHRDSPWNMHNDLVFLCI